MKIIFESDRECTIDGVGLLKPGKSVEVDSTVFFGIHGVLPSRANLPEFIKVTYDTSEEGEN